MIPALPTLFEPQVVRVPPPPRFRPIAGKVYGVEVCSTREAGEEGLSAAQRAGMRYERRVHDYFRSLWGSEYVASPTFSFYDNTGKRYCIPDGILRRAEGAYVVFEIKFQHMPEAWWQLDQLYRPVVAPLAGNVALVEVCRSYDPATPFPCAVHLIENISEWVDAPTLEMGVLRWR